MDRINVIVKRKTTPQTPAGIKIETPFDNRYGFFGMIKEVHPNNNTVDVMMDTGRQINNVRVASFQWVTLNKDKKFLSGQRHLPPVNSFVYCLMPTGEPSSAIVLCSVFPSQQAEYAEFKEDSEDAAFIEKRIDNGGWAFEHDIRTGTRKIRNAPKEGDETISLEVNQEEEEKNKTTLKIYENVFEVDQENKKITATIHGNVFTIDEENGTRAEIEKNIAITVKGDATVSVEGNMTSTVKGNSDVTVEGNMSAAVKGNSDIVADGDLSLKSSKQGTLTMGNAIATLGAMISDLLQALISFKSLGSPAAHTAPELTAAATQIKVKWAQVFK
jgi:hypothetical protein